ncbi:hypothetical protein KCTC32516_00187 [Polaribacter huanghezhanensis]|uniref:DUF389 domain-containing protein n=1 Tax=Polaribacter huanghezhanensis TaxID=1354726 RepID=UPI002648B4C6|nr:DUF389 domain-containing protein [Polaribacter huanghezhanensis]WKD84853.1 hypothetical protein KCTC32516_00187 [Polaribacter huanghezhanensis]
MEENLEKDKAVEQVKQEVKQDAKGLFMSIKKFLLELLDFRQDTDHQATIEAIKVDIPFKGATAWILIFAVFVASIGLNANSTAVVIGAMLISPLMGPILGIGMSIAINDIDTLRKSLINLATMIVLSLLTAFLFFYIFPLSEDNSELLGRVRPDIRDVLIAFFGGLALMVARTKKGTVASVIFGVAIATALMPPLCTAGYGLAIGNFSYFFGAMYLFIINTIFIALATFLVLKLLSFPMLKYINSAKRRRTAQLASVLAIVVMIPAVFTFVTVYKESKMNIQISKFIKNEVNSNPSFHLMESTPNLDTKTLQLKFFNEMGEGEINALNNQLTNNANYKALKDFKLEVKGSNTKSFDLITIAYKDKRQELEDSKKIILGLRKEIEELKNTITVLNQNIEQRAAINNKNAIAFSSIAKEAKIRFQDIEKIGFSKELSSSDFIKIDTIPIAIVKWNPSIKSSIINVKELELRKWMQAEMKLDTLFIKREK